MLLGGLPKMSVYGWLAGYRKVKQPDAVWEQLAIWFQNTCLMNSGARNCSRRGPSDENKEIKLRKTMEG